LSDSHGGRLGLLTAGVACFVMMGVGQSLYGPVLPAFGRLYGVSPAETGMVISAHWLGCAIGIAAMFALGARITPRHALAIMVLGALGLAALAGWGTTLLSAGVFGIGYAMATAVFNPRVLAAFGPRGPSMLSLLNACFGVGAILAPLAFVWLGSDPRIAFLLTAALAALIWLLPGSAGRAGPAPAVTGKGFRPSPPILVFGALSIGIEASLGGLGPTALIASGETEVRAAELLSAFFVVFLIARLVLTFAAHRIPPFALYTGAVVATALLALGGALIAPAPFFVAMGAPGGVFFPAYFVTAARRMGDDPRVPPTIIGAGLVGGIFAPLILAPVMDAFGDRGFFWLIAALAGVTALAALAALRPMLRPLSG
jgi:fucose permease